jgi:hypothetical protein
MLALRIMEGHLASDSENSRGSVQILRYPPRAFPKNRVMNTIGL